MSAACITLDQIESRAATSTALAVYARRVRDGLVAAALARPLLQFLNYRLDQLNSQLRSGALDELSGEQLGEVTTHLKTLNISLLRLGEDGNLRKHASLSAQLEKICASAEDFDSIMENIYLALDPSFHGAVSSAIEQLNLGVEERAALHR